MIPAMMLLAAVLWWSAPQSNHTRIHGSHRDASPPAFIGQRPREPPALRKRAGATLRAAWKPPSTPEDPNALAGDLELWAACVTAGLSAWQAAQAVAGVASEESAERWLRTSGLLRLGVGARAAWAPVVNQPGMEEVAALVRAADSSGMPLGPDVLGVAQRLRDGAQEAVIARAERAGVLIALPLTLCFLPAFFVLGLAPVLISLAQQLW